MKRLLSWIGFSKESERKRRRLNAADDDATTDAALFCQLQYPEAEFATIEDDDDDDVAQEDGCPSGISSDDPQFRSVMKLSDFRRIIINMYRTRCSFAVAKADATSSPISQAEIDDIVYAKPDNFATFIRTFSAKESRELYSKALGLVGPCTTDVMSRHLQSAFFRGEIASSWNQMKTISSFWESWDDDKIRFLPDTTTTPASFDPALQSGLHVEIVLKQKRLLLPSDIMGEIFSFLPKDKKTADMVCCVSKNFYWHFQMAVRSLVVGADTFMFIPTLVRLNVKELVIFINQGWSSRSLSACLPLFAPKKLMVLNSKSGSSKVCTALTCKQSNILNTAIGYLHKNGTNPMESVVEIDIPLLLNDRTFNYYSPFLDKYLPNIRIIRSFPNNVNLLCSKKFPKLDHVYINILSPWPDTNFTSPFGYTRFETISTETGQSILISPANPQFRDDSKNPGDPVGWVQEMHNVEVTLLADWTCVKILRNETTRRAALQNNLKIIAQLLCYIRPKIDKLNLRLERRAIAILDSEFLKNTQRSLDEAFDGRIVFG